MSSIILPPNGSGAPGHEHVGMSTVRPKRQWMPVLIGVILIIAGLGLVVWPFTAATSLLVVFFGTALIANGLGLLSRWGRASARTVAGVLFILAGVFSMVFADFTVSVLVTFVGVTLLIIGIGWLAFTARLVQGARFSLLVLPVAVIAAGIVTLIWPNFSIRVVAVICGLFTIAFGVFILWTARRLRASAMSQYATVILE